MYELKVKFDTASLQTIYTAGMSVVIAKPNGGGRPNVAWIAYRPLPENNVTWEEKYGIYATTTAIQGGAKLTQTASTGMGAAADKLYTLSSSGYFTGPGAGGEPHAFTALNNWEYNDLMTIGLYQNANVNGASVLDGAISAAPVPKKLSASMRPFTNVYVWLQAQAESSSVITTVSSTQTEVSLSLDSPTAELVWDPKSGQFNRANGVVSAAVVQHVPEIL